MEGGGLERIAPPSNHAFMGALRELRGSVVRKLKIRLSADCLMCPHTQYALRVVRFE